MDHSFLLYFWNMLIFNHSLLFFIFLNGGFIIFFWFVLAERNHLRHPNFDIVEIDLFMFIYFIFLIFKTFLRQFLPFFEAISIVLNISQTKLIEQDFSWRKKKISLFNLDLVPHSLLKNIILSIRFALWEFSIKLRFWLLKILDSRYMV